MKPALLVAFTLYMLMLLGVGGNLIQGQRDNTSDYERIMRFYK